MENEFLQGFRKNFIENSFKTISDSSLDDLAQDRSIRNNTNFDLELEKLQREFDSYGAYPFTFDSGTTPAIKQLRSKLLLAKIGSVNLNIDEIGSNLINNTEILNAFLELYDQGLIKQKLTKNTAENQRHKEVEGKTPTNLLLFGTPMKLFDGGQTENEFYSFLETGYARRCLFAIGYPDRKAFHSKTAAEIYYDSVNQANQAAAHKWADQFTILGNPQNHNWKVYVPDDIAIKLISYKIQCEQNAEHIPEHDEVRRAELSHRYFKTLKLAGAFAFIDQETDMSLDHLQQAMKLVEESGEAFQTILTREQSYAKLAKYIASVDTELTHADLYEALPFYSRGVGARNELMNLATAWGYKQHIIIKKSFIDGIEFFRGETLEKTDLDKIMIAYSDSWAYNYEPEEAPFDQLHILTQQDKLQWTNHRFKNKHRTEANVIPGFNMVAIDVDGTATLDMVHEVLKDYTYMTYTTKSHTPDSHRFRLLVPINYVLELDEDDYREFMENVLNWLPFQSDDGAKQRSKTWQTFDGGDYHYNEGMLLDALQFIPKTTKNEEYKQSMQKISSMDNLERWFAQRITSGNRNNNLLKFSLALLDSGIDFLEVEARLFSFNKKLENPLDEDELKSTILQTVAKKAMK